MWPFKRRLPDHKTWPTRARNAPGKYYVDACSLICGLCPQLAPNNCRMNDTGDSCEVFKQPQTPEEEVQLREAMRNSCVQCIHDDGEDKFGQPPDDPVPWGSSAPPD